MYFGHLCVLLCLIVPHQSIPMESRHRIERVLDVSEFSLLLGGADSQNTHIPTRQPRVRLSKNKLDKQLDDITIKRAQKKLKDLNDKAAHPCLRGQDAVNVAECALYLNEEESIKMGSGQTGTVYKGYLKEDNSAPVAVKVSDLEHMISSLHLSEPSAKDLVAQESKFAAKIDHPNILKISQPIFDFDSRKGYLVTEFCELGDLADIMTTYRMTSLDLDCYFWQLMNGLAHLHSKKLAHRDLKPQNVLVNSHGVLKIADFSTSLLVEEQDNMIMEKDVVGTGMYWSPELSPWIAILKEKTSKKRPLENSPETVPKGKGFSFWGSRKNAPITPPPSPPRSTPVKAFKYDPFAADMWAAGVIFLEMKLGREKIWGLPLRADYLFQRFAVSGESFLSHSREWEPDELDMLLGLLELDPKRRMTAKEMTEDHPWFARKADLCFLR